MKKIAIIGTGIAGMACGYFLKGHFDITFYEQNHYPGGHTNTVTISENGKPVYIDTGFMVYNEITYPYLTRLFHELDIPTKATSMSFSVQHLPSGLEYCGTGLSGLFAQRKNLFSPDHWKLVLEIDRFNKEAPEILGDKRYLEYTVSDYVQEKKFSEDFLYKFLIPISSAVWSMPPELMEEFPIFTLVRFFKNHGFLGLNTHYQWRTVIDGSRVYRDKILSFFPNKVRLNQPVKAVIRKEGKTEVIDKQGEKEMYDLVVIASHADQALAMLEQPTVLEKDLLSKFSYQKNKATLHTDESLMPKTKEAWSSWNYRIERHRNDQVLPTTIYYMNSLQHVSKEKNYFVSINDRGKIDPSKILWEADYDHPIYNVAAIGAQKRLWEINQTGPVYFCGSYFRYGFHEDALGAGIEVARRIRGERFWE